MSSKRTSCRQESSSARTPHRLPPESSGSLSESRRRACKSPTVPSYPLPTCRESCGRQVTTGRAPSSAIWTDLNRRANRGKIRRGPNPARERHGTGRAIGRIHSPLVGPRRNVITSVAVSGESLPVRRLRQAPGSNLAMRRLYQGLLGRYVSDVHGKGLVLPLDGFVDALLDAPQRVERRGEADGR